MNKIEGLAEAFRKSRVVFLTTFSKGQEHSRKMTNLNEDPYHLFWFPTEKGTRKVNDIEKDSKVLITFPSLKPGEYYEIEGQANLASQEEVDEKWQWWWLYWRPNQTRRFWFPRTISDPKRVIINVTPHSVKIVKK